MPNDQHTSKTTKRRSLKERYKILEAAMIKIADMQIDDEEETYPEVAQLALWRIGK